ncbi:MAG: hypothetical protein CM1200mP2_54610 [Planctomycetaceae bacterium]|nr:MAG: hypothetical protein CM1200mP2_54610 [Planctomycetaceae bacterium]
MNNPHTRTTRPGAAATPTAVRHIAATTGPPKQQPSHTTPFAKKSEDSLCQRGRERVGEHHSQQAGSEQPAFQRQPFPQRGHQQRAGINDRMQKRQADQRQIPTHSVCPPGTTSLPHFWIQRIDRPPHVLVIETRKIRAMNPRSISIENRRRPRTDVSSKMDGGPLTTSNRFSDGSTPTILSISVSRSCIRRLPITTSTPRPKAPPSHRGLRDTHVSSARRR